MSCIHEYNSVYTAPRFGCCLRCLDLWYYCNITYISFSRRHTEVGCLILVLVSGRTQHAADLSWSQYHFVSGDVRWPQFSDSSSGSIWRSRRWSWRSRALLSIRCIQYVNLVLCRCQYGEMFIVLMLHEYYFNNQRYQSLKTNVLKLYKHIFQCLTFQCHLIAIYMLESITIYIQLIL